MKNQLRKLLPTILRILAITIGIIAQALIHKQLYLSLGLWIVAILLFIFTFRKSPNSFIPDIKVNPITHERVSQWGYIFTVLAVIFSIGSFFLFSTKIPNSFAWIIHLISLVFVTIAAFALTSSRKKRTIKANAWHWYEIVGFITVLLLSLFLRIYKISQLPFGLWFDEADNGLNGLQIFSNLSNIPVYAPSTHLPAHLIYLIAVSIKLFGQTIFSIRLVSALFGVATTAAAYLVGRELFGNRLVGILFAFFMAFSRWDIVWSRIGMHGITVPFFELLTFGLILRALRLQRFKDYLLAGLSMGLGLCFYVPFRLFPLIMIILLIVISITQHNYLKNAWRHLLVFIFGVFIISVPITQFAVFQGNEFWGRVNRASIFADRSLEEGIQVAIRTTGEHLGMFTYKGDRNGRHNIPSEPMLDMVTSSLFFLGIVICFYRIKKPFSILILCWLLFMLAPGIFSLDFESPQTLRTIGSLPAALLISILPIYALLEDQYHKFKRKINIVIATSLILIFMSIGALNAYNYFVREANNSASWLEYSTRDTIIASEMVKYGSSTDFFVSTFYFNTPTIQYLAPEMKQYHRVETNETYPFLLDGERDAIIFLDQDRKPVFEQIKKVYPNGVYTEHKTPKGDIALYEIQLSKEDIQSIQGLIIKYFANSEMTGNPIASSTIKQLNLSWTPENPGALPFYSDISGVLFADRFGTYKFIIESPSTVNVSFDGKQAFYSEGGTFTGSLELAKGVHAIEIKATGDYGNFKMTWQPPDGELSEISPSNLFLPPVTNNGLLGSYYPNAAWEGTPSIIQVDPFLHFYFHNTPLPRPYTVEWVGNILINKPGLYELGLESIDGSQLYIDNTLLVDNKTPNQYQGQTIELTKGFHPIKIRFSDLTGSTHINLFWRPPDSDLQNIPAEVLFLP